GDIAHRMGSYVALLVLHEIQRGQHRRAAAVGRIALHDRFEPGEALRCVRERLARFHQRARRLLERRAVDHLWMKAHRPTSPITTSIDPMPAMPSATKPPTIKRSSA